MKKLSESKAYGGIQGVYSHWSEATNCEMTFGLFMPEEAKYNSVSRFMVSIWFNMHS